MPRTISTTVYKFSELSPEAQKRAIEANYDFNVDYDDWNECVKDDFEAVAKILGIEFDTYGVPLMKGKTRQEPAIWYSGFSSQGDGASFEGRWTYAKGMTKKIRDYAPQDTELHAIADKLAGIQKNWFYGIETRISKSGNYNHEYTMRFEHFHTSDCELPDTVTEEVEEAMRDIARWYYSALESQYDYLTSEEAIRESLEANETEFDEDGNPA